ncbi:MAG: hydroxymethylglutaryl-CoA synthase family protein, partial [Clostridia bacterium]|nr:hydroxymethylglutaryl-CoA synthase family protein [Clostridia bacterium]
MAGITGLDVYVPRYRVSGQTMAAVWGAGGRGERACAGYDEDSLTLAVTAALQCLEGKDASGLDAVFFASTTPPYLEKGNAPLVAGAVDAPRAAWTVDFGHSLRAGVGALRAAAEMVGGGALRRVLVTVGDVRLAEPGTELEAQLGDAGAAVT